MFQKAFILGMQNMLQSKGDIDRLKFMPQAVVKGELLNFQGKKISVVDADDVIIFDAKRVNDASRYTAALQRDYLEALKNHMYLFDGASDAESPANSEDDAKPTLADKVLDVVAEGDRKAGRELVKAIRAEWSELDSGTLEDAIYDLADCIADKDVDGAKKVISTLTDGTPYGFTDVGDFVPETSTTDDVSSDGELPEDVQEIVADLESAIADNDEADIKELLEELKDADPKTHAVWAAKVAPDTKKPKEEVKDEESVEEEIIADLADAVANDDTEEAKELLEELKDEVGADSDTYKEWAEKLAPKKRERRSRR